MTKVFYVLLAIFISMITVSTVLFCLSQKEAAEMPGIVGCLGFGWLISSLDDFKVKEK